MHDDIKISIINHETGHVIKEFSGCETDIKIISISADSSHASALCEDKSVCVWEISTGKLIIKAFNQEIPEFEKYTPGGLKISPDSNYALVFYRKKTATGENYGYWI